MYANGFIRLDVTLLRTATNKNAFFTLQYSDSLLKPLALGNEFALTKMLKQHF